MKDDDKRKFAVVVKLISIIDINTVWRHSTKSPLTKSVFKSLKFSPKLWSRKQTSAEQRRKLWPDYNRKLQSTYSLQTKAMWLLSSTERNTTPRFNTLLIPKPIRNSLEIQHQSWSGDSRASSYLSTEHMFSPNHYISNFAHHPQHDQFYIDNPR